jgi:hypothetical protein
MIDPVQFHRFPPSAAGFRRHFDEWNPAGEAVY